jgi:hypothetical protein
LPPAGARASGRRLASPRRSWSCRASVTCVKGCDRGSPEVLAARAALAYLRADSMTLAVVVATCTSCECSCRRRSTFDYSQLAAETGAICQTHRSSSLSRPSISRFVGGGLARSSLLRRALPARLPPLLRASICSRVKVLRAGRQVAATQEQRRGRRRRTACEDDRGTLDQISESARSARVPS